MIINGYNSLMLMTEKSLMYPGVSTGNIASESMYEDEGVRQIMESHFEVGRKIRELEFGMKLDKSMRINLK